MTGRGCDDIFRILDENGLTFGDMFERCERRYGTGNYHFTRLDVAIDDRNETPFFTIEQIKKKCEKRNLFPTVRTITLTRASLTILTPQRPSISGLENHGFPTAFMTKTKKCAANTTGRLMKSGVGNGRKCNCVMKRLMPLLWHFRKDRWRLGNWLSDCWRTTCVLSWQTGTRATKAGGKRAVSGNAFRGCGTLKTPCTHTPHNSLEETQQWLTEGGVISAVKGFYFLESHDALGGLERVGDMVDRARYSTSLSSKLTAHLQRIDRTELIPYVQYDTKEQVGGGMMNERLIFPYGKNTPLPLREASRYFTIGQNKLRRLVEENRHGDWYVMNGNRILIKKKQFEKFMDKTGRNLMQKSLVCDIISVSHIKALSSKGADKEMSEKDGTAKVAS